MTKESDNWDDDVIEADREELAKAVRLLRDFVEKENCLKVRTDDNFLLRYLRSAQYNLECAIQKMQNYYSLKRQHPEWYVTHESISSFESDLASHLYYVLEDRDRFGKRVFINKLGMIDTSKTTMTKQSQLQDLFLECILDEEETQKNGVSVIVDLKSFSWTLLKWLTPANVCIAVKKIEIHFHYDDWPSLHKVIDPEYLPQQYGGRKPDVNIEKLLKIIPGSKENLSENLRLGYDRDSHT